MASVCFYFQIHQPYRLRRYSIFDSAADYFNEPRNHEIVQNVAGKCYRPALGLLLELLGKHPEFRLALSVTGTAMEQLEAHAPDVVGLLKELAGTGRVEFLGETYYHSLAFVYSVGEFHEQVDAHAAMLQRTLKVTPVTFRNTELIYSNDLAAELAGMGYQGVLTEGWEGVLGKRPPSKVYRCPPGTGAETRVLVRNYRLSDDISFRFSQVSAPDWPLTAGKFAARVEPKRGAGLCNLFMDLETFGEHQSEATGIFDFLRELPGALLKARHGFILPREAVAGAAGKKLEVLDVPAVISWADEARDLSAWAGNAMQTSALQEIYRLEEAVKKHPDPQILADWRRLTTSDHVYYMSTKHYGDGQVHGYFSPYESPYDAYINVMNVLDNLRARLRR